MTNSKDVKVRVKGIIKKGNYWYQIDEDAVFYGIKDSEFSLVRLDEFAGEENVIVAVRNSSMSIKE